MEKDLNNKEFYNDMLKEMVKIITVSKTEMSVMQTAEAILHEYIKRTEHHIWLVNQCAGILKDVLVENGQDVSEFMARVEYHDYDKLHNPKIIPVYAVACDYYYGEGKKNYEVHEEGLYNEFELIAWPEHHRANVHHVAEHYGKRDGENKPFIVPPTQDYLAIGEMIADWMAMSITHGDSAREWYKKTKGVKWTFSPIDEKIIEKFLKAEDEAYNQLAYLRQFKTWEVSTVAMQQAPTISEENPQENNGVNEGIENFYRELEKSEDIDTKDTLYIEPIEQENLVNDESSELDTYIEQISKLVAEMEPMELKHKLGKYDDDDLAIGRISDKHINMDIVNELMKYPRYLEVLKHWITVPDYTLLPDLARFGAIIDNIYKFNKPIVAYRGMRVGLVKAYKAQHEMGLVITEDGGMNDDGIEMVLKVPKPGVNEGYSFDYTIDGPLSVSRSIWITKIYGNLIVKTVIPPTAKKLVITNELAYVLQKLEARYFNYRPMNLSSRTEIILFPNQTFKFEVVTTHGDISEELSEFNEMFYNLQEDTNEVVAGSENSIGHEAFCDQILDVKSCEGFFDAVSEKDSMHYTIRNFPAAAFLAKMKREYKTTKLEHLFSSIGIKWLSHRAVSIHKFFVPELLYLLQKFNFPKSLISTIEQTTWVSKPTEVTVAQNIGLIDKNMKCELFKHQQEFIDSYSANKHENHLRGYLLSFDQGLGKTITALALMESLGKERVVIICPKNTMVETWGYHIETFYKNKQTIWYAGGKEKLTNQRFLIVNYDRISEIEAVAMSSKNLGIVVDESHNFLRTASQRTKILMEIASSTNNADILLQSGTPIKCTGVEMIPMMSVLDPYFDQEAINTFKQTFGFNTSIANDVLHARLNRMMTRVTKTILDLPKKEESIIKVKMTTGKKYTLGVVKEGVRKFIAERRAYYHSKAKEYNDAFDEVLEWLDMSPMFKKDFDYMKWRGIIDWLRSEDISDVRGNTEIIWANKYEIEVIEPALPPELCKQFRWCKTAVKYVNLKIKGEVIGTYLMRLRMDMTSEMLEAADIKQYVDNAVKKTIIFTSYVDTIESAEKYFKNNGYDPLVVYGKTSSELTETVRRFQSDPGTNPLIASLKMLSTGATLTAANTVIFLNKPWRSIEYQQASDRVHRIGQDTDCVIYSLVLDTGAEDNLSTRMEDVMNWSDDQFSQIVDSKERSFLEKVFGPMPIINWVRSFFSNEEYTNEDVVKIDSSSNESMVLLQSNPQERELTRLAKQLYNPIGANSWEHIQQVVGQASLMVNGVYKRTLNLKEYAACLFHDCSVKSRPDKVKHSLYSAEIAKPILTKTGYFTPEEVEEVYQAIVEHDGETNPNFIHSTLTSDVLSSADTNPPNVAWILNKMYVYRLRHNRPAELIFEDIAEYSKEAYGLKSKRRYPVLYANFYGKEIVTMGKTIDSLTPEDCERIIMDYRARHKLGPNDLVFPDPSLESIAVETLSTKEYTEVAQENFFKSAISWVEAKNFFDTSRVDDLKKQLDKLLTSDKHKLDITKIENTPIRLFTDQFFVLPTNIPSNPEEYIKKVPCFYFDIENQISYGILAKKYSAEITMNKQDIKSIDSYKTFVTNYVKKCYEFFERLRKFYMENSNNKFDTIKERTEFGKRCANAFSHTTASINRILELTKKMCVDKKVTSTEALSTKEYTESDINSVDVLYSKEGWFSDLFKKNKEEEKPSNLAAEHKNGLKIYSSVLEYCNHHLTSDSFFEEKRSLISVSAVVAVLKKYIQLTNCISKITKPRNNESEDDYTKRLCSAIGSTHVDINGVRSELANMSKCKKEQSLKTAECLNLSVFKEFFSAYLKLSERCNHLSKLWDNNNSDIFEDVLEDIGIADFYEAIWNDTVVYDVFAQFDTVINYVRSKGWKLDTTISNEALNDELNWRSPASISSNSTDEEKEKLHSLLGEYVYHGGPIKYNILKPTSRKDFDEPVLFFSPFAYMASLFCTEHHHVRKGLYDNKYVSMSSWTNNTNTYEGLDKPAVVVEIVHNIKDLKPYTIIDTGYLHCVKTSKVINNILPYNRWDNYYEFVYFGNGVSVDKVIPVKQTIHVRYDKQCSIKQGGDAIPSSLYAYRILYNNVGIYDAFKQNASSSVWNKFKNSDMASWLPIPEIEYKTGYKSYFTEKGLNEFCTKVLPYFKDHLDNSLITIEQYDSTYLNWPILYSDKYQFVTNGKEPTQCIVKSISEFSNEALSPQTLQSLNSIDISGIRDGGRFDNDTDHNDSGNPDWDGSRFEKWLISIWPNIKRIHEEVVKVCAKSANVSDRKTCGYPTFEISKLKISIWDITHVYKAAESSREDTDSFYKELTKYFTEKTLKEKFKRNIPHKADVSAIFFGDYKEVASVVDDFQKIIKYVKHHSSLMKFVNDNSSVLDKFMTSDTYQTHSPMYEVNPQQLFELIDKIRRNLIKLCNTSKSHESLDIKATEALSPDSKDFKNKLPEFVYMLGSEWNIRDGYISFKKADTTWNKEFKEWNNNFDVYRSPSGVKREISKSYSIAKEAHYALGLPVKIIIDSLFFEKGKLWFRPQKDYTIRAKDWKMIDVGPLPKDKIGNEALSPDVKKKKQLIIDYICSICDIMDPSKLNSKRYHRLLDNMNDKEFDQWMHYVKEGKWRLHIVAPNLVINLKNENLLKAADKAKCKLFHRIWMTDHATGRQYLTDNEYLVLTLPVRRQQQFLDEKMSVPDNDRQIDGMTGQVTGDSRSSSITNPEIQILASRKLDATLEELVNVRGGNMLAYGEFKRQAEETGEISMTMFDPNTRSRVAVVGQVLLNSMHIDTNIIE